MTSPVLKLVGVLFHSLALLEGPLMFSRWVHSLSFCQIDIGPLLFFWLLFSYWGLLWGGGLQQYPASIMVWVSKGADLSLPTSKDLSRMMKSNTDWHLTVLVGQPLVFFLVAKPNFKYVGQASGCANLHSDPYLHLPFVKREKFWFQVNGIWNQIFLHSFWIHPGKSRLILH